ncbi:hypothetical protein [Achromobacter anxifer]|uniref:hypothetical protein n=1 Tax=Achromobacter anxifer TaxID=1287737 RepID=UPI0023F7FC9B|nr:hypothetical protein [Achromobacter anxifer]MDF8360540.1 hypothetical protein [Achromobacter anxifer]
MIPIALPSAGFYIFISLGFLAGLVLLAWAVVLVASGGARRAVRKYWKTSSLVFIVLAVPFAFYAWVQTVIWQIEREGARAEAARNVTLQEATTVGGTAMPAGTRLKLQDEGQLETYLEAEFPQPVAMYGVMATSVRRFLGTDYDSETYALRERYPRSVILRGAGSQTVRGWQCDAMQDIEFDVERDGAMTQLSKCVLGPGNRVETLELAPGSIVYESSGTVYTDGARDPDRWRIEVKNPVAVKVFGLPLSEPRLYLDEARHLLRVSDAELACPTRFGDVSYAVGTQVKSVRRGRGDEREPFPGVLVLSPWNGQAAKRDGQADVPEGMSVMQTLAGEVVDVVKNDTVGVFHFATFVVGDEEPEVRRAACP